MSSKRNAAEAEAVEARRTGAGSERLPPAAAATRGSTKYKSFCSFRYSNRTKKTRIASSDAYEIDVEFANGGSRLIVGRRRRHKRARRLCFPKVENRVRKLIVNQPQKALQSYDLRVCLFVCLFFCTKTTTDVLRNRSERKSRFGLSFNNPFTSSCAMSIRFIAYFKLPLQNKNLVLQAECRS